MGKKLTHKQEAFAQAVVATGNQSEAYRIAYDVGENTKPETVWRKSSEVMSHGHVSARVEELRAATAERLMVTIESLTKELEEAREFAKTVGQAAAMTSAIMGKAKLHGFLVDKQEVKSFNVTISGDDADL